jgi:GNAT superfamily N-acetyltransferase
MAEFVKFDPNVHMDYYVDLYIEYMTYIFKEVKEVHQIDFLSRVNQTVEEWINDNLEPYINLKPPEGILIILKIDGEAVGMGTLRKVRENVGEIKRMYNRPKIRRQGYARQMLNKLMELGKEMGCISFLLDTPKFSVAHYLYRSAGFKEIEEYPETEIPLDLRQHWYYMEKK